MHGRVQTSRVQYPWDPFFGTPFGAKGGGAEGGGGGGGGRKKEKKISSKLF